MTCCVVDAQASYESMMTLMAAGVAGIYFVLHTAGILQYYMAMSYEKFITDDESAGMVLRYLKGIEFSDEQLAFDVIAFKNAMERLYMSIKVWGLWWYASVLNR